ncbi:type IV pilus modification protein PilV [Pseudomonas sp. F1_0610]|uniref:type IV pilus modification protein PilV n=1 Tax=Pseudomonas sp. F1_0610 TaxID=3114284 RepID=UPI0039C39D8B
MKAQKNGFSLIEVLITLLIVSIGILGLAAMQLKAIQSTNASIQRSHAVWLMQDLVERMRTNKHASNDTFLATVKCNAKPAKACASYTDPKTGQVTKAQACTAQEMATFDRWDTFCSQTQHYALPGIFFNSRDSIVATTDGVLQLKQENDSLILNAKWYEPHKEDKYAFGEIAGAFSQEIQR